MSLITNSETAEGEARHALSANSHFESAPTGEEIKRTRHRLPWWLCLLAISVLAFCVSLGMSWSRLPVPSCHDEFSHLLVADTLRHGRLANPAPELWQPFQSFHVLVNPSYASKFPLGPGALFALGWTLIGTPAAGIWFGAAFCTGAVTWAAAGCMPRRWAVLAGLMLTLNPNVHHQWSLNYMNGWLTAAAAALVAGAVLRLRKRSRAVDSLVLGIGVSGLALTRPFEGVVFTLSAAGLLLFWWRSDNVVMQLQRSTRIVRVAVLPLAATFLLIAVHNRATTGNLFQMPYQLHEQQYGVAPLSIFQSQLEPQMMEWSADVPPTVLEFHYGWSLESYCKRNHLSGWCGAIAERFHVVAKLWGISFCVLAACMVFSRVGAHRTVAWAIGAALFVSSFVPWFFSHYFAPSLVWLVILTTLALHWMIGRLVSDRPAVKSALATLVIMQVLCMGAEIGKANTREITWADERDEIISRLNKQDGQHLVLVRYGADHDVHHEWVYNGADLEQAPIIWARSWRPDLDNRLQQHYPDRTVWILEFDEQDRAELSRQ